jgi:hypothetical protein
MVMAGNMMWKETVNPNCIRASNSALIRTPSFPPSPPPGQTAPCRPASPYQGIGPETDSAANAIRDLGARHSAA